VGNLAGDGSEPRFDARLIGQLGGRDSLGDGRSAVEERGLGRQPDAVVPGCVGGREAARRLLGHQEQRTTADYTGRRMDATVVPPSKKR